MRRRWGPCRETRVARGWALAVAAAAWGATATAQTPPAHSASPGLDLPVREIVLENGLRILALPREGAPVVSFVVRYGVGGVNEHLGTTGTAHLLEHMLFKGTTSIGTRNVDAERALFARMDAIHDTLLLARAAGDTARVRALDARIDALEDSARVYVVSNEFDRILTRAGARGLNATTTSEATTYFVQLPANRIELWFVLEADRFRNPVFREFYTERDVVMEERRMRIDASPGGTLYEQHLATAFLMHPYGVPVVGYMSDLETLRRRDVEDYYRRYYGAANAVVAIVGAIDPDEVERLARRYLSEIPRGETPPPVLAREPEQRGTRRIEVTWDAEPAVRMGWHVPSSVSDDGPALAVLASLLTGGRTSRLYRRLILEDRIAGGVFASLGPGSRFPQLLQIDATPRAPHTAAEVERAVLDEIRRLAEEGPTEDELRRVRTQVAAGSIRRLRAQLGLAFQLAESAALFGDWRETFRYADRLRAVDAEAVRRIAATYLTPERLTVATLVRREGS